MLLFGFLEKKDVIIVVIIFFITSLSTAYLVITILPHSYYEKRVYSIPSNKGNYTSSTRGGEALIGIEGDDSPIPPVPVFLGPRPGAINVSLNTIIDVYQTRPVMVDFLQLDPEIAFARIENKHEGVASRDTIFYPAELLQPDTTYNVSCSIMGFSAWWTFTTASAFSQPEYESILTPYAWWIAFAASSIATIIFTRMLWRSKS